MDHSKLEFAIVEETATKATDAQMTELYELQLACVGGGVGEITPY